MPGPAQRCVNRMPVGHGAQRLRGIDESSRDAAGGLGGVELVGDIAGDVKRVLPGPWREDDAVHTGAGLRRPGGGA